MEVAAENYSILNNGLITLTEVRIRQNSWLSNSILVFYIFAALLMLRFFILKSLKYNEEREKEQASTIVKLSERLTSYENELLQIKEKERGYSESIGELNREKANLSSDIDGLLTEMERLESGLKAQKELRETREMEIAALKKEIEEIKLKSEKPKKKGRKQENNR
jgi:chromosome segregation ATPase